MIKLQKITDRSALENTKEPEVYAVETTNEQGVLEPHLGMQFDSAYAARTFYDEYAKLLEFTTKLGPAVCSKIDGSFTTREFLCSREGSKKPLNGCDAMIRVELQSNGKWVITKFTKEHGHPVASPMVIPNRVCHTPHSNFADLVKKVVENSPGVGTAPRVGTVPKVGTDPEVETASAVPAVGTVPLDVSEDENHISLDADCSAANAPLIRSPGAINFSQGMNPEANNSARKDPLLSNRRTINHAQSINSEPNHGATNSLVSNRGTVNVNHAQSNNSDSHHSSRSVPFTSNSATLNPAQSNNVDTNRRNAPPVSNSGTMNHAQSTNLEFNRKNAPSVSILGAMNFSKGISAETGRSAISASMVSNPGTISYPHNIISDAPLVSTSGTSNAPHYINADAPPLVSSPGTINYPLFSGPSYAFPYVNSVSTLNYSARPLPRKRTLGRDAQNLLQYLKKMQAENPGFFYAIHLDENNCLVNVFWADARSRAAYDHFGDVLTFDTYYKVYNYKVPCAAFTGVNHHSQTVLFGCALLLDDSEASFVWLFKTFLTAMNDQPPLSIVTDQDRAIQGAVSAVFPGARHCISKWHILRDGQEILSHIRLAHPDFEVELYNCINLTETIEEFELSWNAILDKYDLRRNDWLQSLYNIRVQWAPAYFRNSFFAAIFPNQGFEGSFFDGYVNQQTTLPLFFRQYERAVDSCFNKEIRDDFDSMCTGPVLKTPSPMEKQAANLYTRRIFSKFQDELVETFVYTANRIEGDGACSTFRVAKFEDDSRAYTVTLNFSDMTANCSCQMFEYSGILCRHVLTVFTVTNVLTLPPHYILKRWTKNAKVGSALDDRAVEQECQESVTVRYNNLCREAIRCVEEGATTVETYNAAINYLRDVRKKISSLKKNVAKIPPVSGQASGMGSMSDVTPLLWPRQDEISRRSSVNHPPKRDEFNRRSNVNDVEVPSQSVDFSLPSMAQVSLHQDDGPPDTSVNRKFPPHISPIFFRRVKAKLVFLYLMDRLHSLTSNQ